MGFVFFLVDNCSDGRMEFLGYSRAVCSVLEETIDKAAIRASCPPDKAAQRSIQLGSNYCSVLPYLLRCTAYSRKLYATLGMLGGISLSRDQGGGDSMT